MATIQGRPLSVAETKKLKSNAGVPNLNFQLQVEIYKPPSLSPQSLSNDSDEHLMSIDLREEEAPVTSRSRNTSGNSSSSCSSRNVDENLPNSPSNAVDEHIKADVDGEDGLLNGGNTGKTPTSSGLIRNSDTSCNDHNVLLTIYECTICDFVTNYQQKLADHQRTAHCLNKGRDSDHSSHDLTQNPFLESGQNHILDPPHQNSSQDNSTFVKEEGIDVEDEDGEAPPTDGVSVSLANKIHALDESLCKKKKKNKKKKNKNRQEVEPCKYLVVFHEGGSKYACSECSNFYKWKKSLNKHWREKHNMKPLLKTDNPPGLIKLLKTGKYSLVGSRKLYDSAFFKKIQTTQSDAAYCAAPSSTNLTPSHHLPDMLKVESLPRTPDLPSPLVPLFANKADSLATVQAAFPVMPMGFLQFPVHSNDYHSPEEGVLDLSCNRNRNSDNSTISGTHPQDRVFSSEQAQLPNFIRGNVYENVPLEIMWKNEPSTSHPVKELPWCTTSDFPGTSEAVSAGYINSEIHKGVVTCEECKLQTQSMGELNNHFIKNHIQKLSDCKEAIRKIPHGLQQVYHLLNNELVELGHRDLESAHGRSLQCKKCDFESQSPADFQKHAMSHTEERPFVCMVCGKTYKLKWDLVKHFNNSHAGLPNPYQRNDITDAGNEDSEEGKPSAKKAKLRLIDVNDSDPYNKSDTVSVERNIERKTIVSCQQNSLDRVIKKNQNLPSMYLSTDMHMEQKEHMDQTAQKNDRSRETQTARTKKCMSGNGSRVSNSCKTNSTIRKRTMEEGGSDSPRGYTPDNYPCKCPQCDLHFHSLSDMEQHMKIHFQEKKFKCPSCDYRSKWKSDVTKHKKRCTGVGIGYVNDTSKPKKLNASVSSRSQNVIVNKKGKGKQNRALSNSAETDGQQLASLKEASPSTYRDSASPSKTSPIISTNPSLPRRNSSGHISSPAIWKCSHCAYTTHNHTKFKYHPCKRDGDKPFKCDRCNYSSNWSGDLKKHRRRHNHEKLQSNCSHCRDCFDTLQELIYHCSVRHFDEELSHNSPVTLMEMEDAVDVARIKHPRKRNFHCLECPFVCSSQQALEAHKLKTFHCLYCKSMFKNKESLRDHIIAHEEFTPKEWFTPEEWELLFPICDTQHEAKYGQKILPSVDNKDLGKHNSGTMETCQPDKERSHEKSARDTDSSLLRISPVQAKKSEVAQWTQLMHTCEWCLEQFMYFTALRNHIESCHATQQEDQVAGKATMDTSSQILPPFNGMDVGEINCCMTDAMKETENNRKTCNLSLASSELQVKHCESKEIQCWFCDARQEDLNHLYKHVTASHGSGRYNLALDPTSTVPGSDSVCNSSQDAMDVSPKNQIFSSKMANSVTCIVKEQYTWDVVPVNVVVVGCALKFACTFCAFKNASILETSRHVYFNHSDINKFKCMTCHFSHYKEEVMFDHCTNHLQPERVVEVLDFKQIDRHDLLMLFLDALKKSIACDIGKGVKASPCNKSVIH